MTAFGPYRHHQVVNFEQLGEEAIFLITGPTGAGKTTLFDAMAFALYGRASGSDRDQDTLRSDFAKVTEVTEVTFVFQLRGKTYKVTRFPKQRRKKERGEGFKEEPARAELYLEQNGSHHLMASRIKEVNEMLEEMLALDYEQFRKMIMIPQGEFRRLISENSKEREEILQRIFRTHFYEQMTEQLKEDTKSLKESLSKLEWLMDQEFSKVEWASEEEPDDNLDRLAMLRMLDYQIERGTLKRESLQEEWQNLKKKSQQKQEMYYKGQRLQDLFTERRTLKEEHDQLMSKQTAYQELESTIQWAERAAEIQPIEDQLEAKRADSEQLKKQLNEKRPRRDQAKHALHKLDEEYQQIEAQAPAREQLKETIKQKQREQAKVQELETLRQKHHEVIQWTDSAAANLKQLETGMDKAANERSQLKEKAQYERDIHRAYVEASASVQHMEQQAAHVNRLEGEMQQLLTLHQDFRAIDQAFKHKKQEVEDKKQAYVQTEARLKSQHAYHLASQLAQGSPCPVCGSTHHPDVAKPGEAEVSDDDVHHEQERYLTAERELNDMQERYYQIKSEKESQKARTDRSYEDVHDILEDMTEENIKQVREWLQNQIHHTQHEQAKKESELSDIQQAAERITQLDQQLDEEHAKWKQINAELHGYEQQKLKYETLMGEAKKELSDDDVDAESLNQGIQQAQTKLKQMEEQWETVQQEHQKQRDAVKKLETEITELHKYLQKEEQTAHDLQSQFHNALNTEQFHTEAAYHQHKLSKAKREELVKDLHAYQQRLNTLNSRLHQLNELLHEEDEPFMEELKAALDQAVLDRDNKQQQLNEIDLYLKHHQAISEELHTLVEEQAARADEYYDVAELADLTKGENHLRLSLERYVLASFLDEILMQANQRLDQMTDHRYQLLRSDQIAKRGAQSGLDLEVLDQHTGQKRSVKTLSGGEGFKAALSLALGMADVVQSHAGGVQLDTLFIDEGFGTLDERSLEQAIDCLKELQEGHRMLGIISHVPQLKEEIPAKLQITPSPEGSRVHFMFD
nr:SMC family ATPase [Thalassobacillus sp. CUG 92003]